MNVSNVLKVDFTKTQKLTGVEKVNLRDIWLALEQPKEFSPWAAQVTKRLKKDNDFGVIDLQVKNSGRGRPQKNYWVTVATAKKIAMATLNEAGDKVRDYFLECEKLVMDNGLSHQITSVPDLMDPDFIIALAMKLKEETKLRVVAENNFVVEQTAHITTKENSRISDVKLRLLEAAIGNQTKILSPFMPDDIGRFQIKSVMQKMIKARFTRAHGGATFKEVREADVEACIAWVGILGTQHILAARSYKNSAEDLANLDFLLQQMGV